jgi:Protein of unknown function (DUF3168)
MILETGLRAYLVGLDAITALVAERIYGMVREQGNDQTLPVGAQLPAVLIMRDNSIRQQLFCGTSPLVQTDVQVDSFAMTGDDAWGLAKALRAALVDFNGLMGLTWVDTVHLNNEFPITDPDPGIIRVKQIYTMFYLEE